MPLIIPANTLSGDYDISGSCRFQTGDSPALSYSFSSTASSWTVSFWTKLTGKHLSVTMYPWSFGTAGSDATGNSFSGSGLAYWDEAGNTLIIDSTILLRDPSAWSHIVCKNNGGTITTYINGVQQASGSGGTSLDGSTFYIGRYAGSTAYHFDGYISEFYFIDGTAYSPSTFGETNDNGVWIPKNASVTFGSDGFFCEFKQTGTSANASGIGADTSGNGNHLTVSNVTATDICTDSPTNNFATMNPLVPTTDVTFSEGNLKMAFTNSGKGSCLSTIGMTNGKWYFENKAETVGGGTMVGIFGEGVDIDAWPSYLDGVGVISPNGYKSVNGTETAYGDSYTDGDIVSVALDLTNDKIYWAKNGTWMNSGDPTSGSTGTGALSLTDGKTWFAGFADGSGSTAGASIMNFGNPPYANSSSVAAANGYGAFEYAPPSGYYAICTKNLAEYG